MGVAASRLGRWVASWARDPLPPEGERVAVGAFPDFAVMQSLPDPQEDEIGVDGRLQRSVSLHQRRP